jgi:hypothetical protein
MRLKIFQHPRTINRTGEGVADITSILFEFSFNIDFENRCFFRFNFVDSTENLIKVYLSESDREK